MLVKGGPGGNAMIILGVGLANVRRHYYVTLPHTGRTQIHVLNDACIIGTSHKHYGVAASDYQ